MNRRAFLISAAALPAGLSACAAFDQNFQNGLHDAEVIADGLMGVLEQLGKLEIAGITPALVATIGGYVADVKSAAAALSTAVTEAQAQPLVQKIETYVNAIVTALAGLPLPPPISTALQAAAVLLPVIEAAVGLVVSPRASTMTTDEARRILRSAAVAAQ